MLRKSISLLMTMNSTLLKKTFKNTLTLKSPTMSLKKSLYHLLNPLILFRESEISFPLAEEKASRRRRTHSWSASEDNRLIFAIHHDGFGDWSKVAAFVGNGRTRSQCSQRWHRTLDPRINKNNWSSEDDKKLIEAVQKYGANTWTKVAKYIGARTDVQCRYRYLLIQKHEKNIKKLSSGMKTKLVSSQKLMKQKKDPVAVKTEPATPTTVSDESDIFLVDSEPNFFEFNISFEEPISHDVAEPQWRNIFDIEDSMSLSSNYDIYLQ